MNLKLLVICFLSLVLVVNSLKLGDHCTVRSSSSRGVCKLMSDCQSVANAISHNFTKPTYCNNDCWTVCCPTSRKSNQTIETYQIPSNPKKRQHCTVEKNNMPGKCLPLLECGSVMEALRNDITAIPTICDNDLQTVCCPSISELKCREYGVQSYTRNYSTNGETQVISTCVKALGLIIGGVEAGRKEFPHMALVGKDSYSCGGSLISDQWVLTAAHCLPATVVKLGSNRRSDFKEEHLKYSVIKVIQHSEYRRTTIMLNDIALLKLDRVVVFTDRIVPICLQQTSVMELKAVATGWGLNATSPSESLMKVELDMFSFDECKRNSASLDKDMMICAGHRTARRDTCSGDSGGPLQVQRVDMLCMFTVIGVTSFGFSNCGRIGVPGVYANTYNYLDWIESIVWPEEV